MSVETVNHVLKTLIAAMQAATAFGINIQAVSDRVAQAKSEDRDLTEAEMDQLRQSLDESLAGLEQLGEGGDEPERL